MANDPNNIRLGPCRVRWGGVDLGLTKGGVEVEVSTTTKEVTVDQFGETPVNEYVTGRKLSVKCPFAETDLDTLFNLMRFTGATINEGGGIKATGTITLTTNPVANDTVIVNGVTFTFVATASATGQVAIGASATATRNSLLTALQASANPLVNAAVFASSSTNAITVTFKTSGTAGNAYTLAKTGTGVTVSGATLTGGTAGTGRRVEVTSGIGLSLYSTAQELVLHPTEKPDADRSEDFVIPKAATAGGLSFAYQNDTERLFNLTFNGYPDVATGLLFIYGDKGSA
jgi:hypothetical protein